MHGNIDEGGTVSDGKLARIRDREFDERRRSIAYVVALAAAGIVAIAASVAAIAIVARLVG